MQAARTSPQPDPDALSERYRQVRFVTEALCAPLSAEDCVVQSMPDASPAKWHLAHTTWFFETLILEREIAGYEPVDPAYRVLFNSYYNRVGPQHPRPQRGMLTRPRLEQVYAYRAKIDARMLELLAGQGPLAADTRALVELGLHHEQQHQELLLMDVKHLLSCNPMWPAYRAAALRPGTAAPLTWIEHEGGEIEIGAGMDGFAFDNERPRHRVLLAPYALASRPVTNGEWLEFIDDDGYRRAELWLSDGWAAIRSEGRAHPYYWRRTGDGWEEYTLRGPQPLDASRPVSHVSYYEADAYATWRGARLPSEAEWEHAAHALPIAGNFLESDSLHPQPAAGDGPVQMFGDLWEWTRSGYGPYPRYRPPAGALGEYNGKFMVNQLVLRGGACVTPASHVRPTYRNFFYPHTTWQFSGVRLARDAD